MKKIFTLMAAVLCVISIGAQQRKADTQTAQWRYEIQPTIGQAANGSALVRVWSYSKNSTIATTQAGKNAVHGIIFKGYPTVGTIVGREPLLADPMAEEVFADYFKKFFAEGGAYQRYVSYANNGIPDQTMKVGKEYKIAVTVIVMVDQLRERLEADGIIQTTEQAVQGKMPSVMVVPSTVFCKNHKYMKQFNNNGVTESMADYDQALMDNNVNQAITAINARLTKRGFEVKNLRSALATLKTEAAEQALLTSKEGAAVAETPIDVLRRVAKADIWVEIDWSENVLKGGSQKNLTFTMSAIDAYTDFVVGGIPPTTSSNEYSASFNVPALIEPVIQGQFEPFCNTLIDYFKDLANKGRAIKMQFLVWDDFDGDLMTEYDGAELHEIIEDWVADNTVKGKYGAPDISPSGNRMTIEQARMPLVNKKGRDNDPSRWARELKNMLKNEYGIECNVSSKGLGEIQIVIGSK